MSDSKNLDSVNRIVKTILGYGQEQALEIARAILDHYQTGFDDSSYVDEMLEIGLTFDKYGELDQALKAYHWAEKRALATGDKGGLRTAYSNIGTVHNNSQFYNKALEYYEKALELTPEEDFQEIGILYNNIGFVYKNVLNYEKSVEYYVKSVIYLKKANDKFSMTASYFNLADLFSKVDDYERAIEYIDKCIEIDKELHLQSLKSDMKYRESLKAKLDKTQTPHTPKIVVNKPVEKVEKVEEKTVEQKKDNKKGWFRR